jgi:hypothetical protein
VWRPSGKVSERPIAIIALHYLKAVAATGNEDGAKVAEAMRAIPVNDLLIKNTPDPR